MSDIALTCTTWNSSVWSDIDSYYLLISKNSIFNRENLPHSYRKLFIDNEQQRWPKIYNLSRKQMGKAQNCAVWGFQIGAAIEVWGDAKLFCPRGEIELCCALQTSTLHSTLTKLWFKSRGPIVASSRTALSIVRIGANSPHSRPLSLSLSLV